MAQPSEPAPVKFFVALLRGLMPPARIIEVLEEVWGPVDYQSQPYPFDQTITIERRWATTSKNC